MNSTKTQVTKDKKQHIGFRDIINIVIKYAGEYRRQIFIISVFVIVLSISEAAIPFFTGKFYDSLGITLKNKDIATILVSSIGVFFITRFILVFINRIAEFIRLKLEIRLSREIDFNFRSNVFAYILRMAIDFFAHEKIGVIENKVRTAGNGLNNIIGKVTIRALPHFISMLISFIVCLVIDYRMFLILLVSSIIFCIIIFKRYKNVSLLQKEASDMTNEIQGTVLDALQNISVVKDTVSEEYESKRIGNVFNEKLFNIYIKIIDHNALSSLLSGLIRNTTSFFILGIGAILIINNHITIGQLIMFSSYLVGFFDPLQQLAFQWEEIQNGVIALRHVEEILEKKQEGNDRSLKLKGKIHTIVFDNVSFGYNDETNVLDNVSCEIQSGMRIALVGKSGGGKSTIIKLLSAHHVPQNGLLKINNIDTHDIDIYDLRRRIAVVPQDMTLFNDTIENNIKYGSFTASRKAVVEAARKAHALEFIEAFPNTWQQIVGERGIKLSGGQKQRIAIARAILRDPQILILDEPTSALDAESEHFINEALDELMKNRTTFIIAHRLSTVRRADLILVLDKGSIVERGTHNELLDKNGVYKQLHDLQIGLHE